MGKVDFANVKPYLFSCFLQGCNILKYKEEKPDFERV